MSAPLRVTLLRFTSPTAFSEAFALIFDSDLVASCTAEPEFARIHFLAPARCAEALVQAIYQRAGLRWCSQHDVVIQRAADAAQAPGGPRAAGAPGCRSGLDQLRFA